MAIYEIYARVLTRELFACIIVLAPFSIIVATSFKTLSDAVKVPFTFYEGYLDFTSYKAI